MIFKIYYRKAAGSHIYCRLFAGRREGALGKCGDFIMRSEEFKIFVKIVLRDFKPFEPQEKIIFIEEEPK